MNKIPVILASACAFLLMAAGAGLVFMLWQSWEDGRHLEKQNRELQASLEASRIRIENYCEYPAEALCPVDSTAGRQTRSAYLPEEMASALEPSAVRHPEKAERMEAVADADSNQGPLPPAAQAAPESRPSAEGQPLPAVSPDAGNPAPDEGGDVPASAEKAEEQDAVPAEERNQSSLPPAAQAAPESRPSAEGQPLPAVSPDAGNPAPDEGGDVRASAEKAEGQDAVPAEDSNQSSLPPEGRGTDSRTGAESMDAASAAEAQPEALLASQEQAQQKNNGSPEDTSFSSSSEQNVQRTAEDSENPAAAVISKADEYPDAAEETADPKKWKKTWSSVTMQGDMLLLRIAGEGEELNAKGTLADNCYEVLLEGLWKINFRLQNQAKVKAFGVRHRDGNTILAFSLGSMPSVCRVRNEDRRTIAIEIQ